MPGVELNHKGTTPIKTQRLILRRFKADDAQSIYDNWLKDPEVTKYLRVMAAISLSKCSEVLAKWLNSYSSPDYYRWGIVLAQTGELIGEINAHSESEYDGIAQTGYVIGRKYWSKGYATEALRAVIHYLIFEVAYNRVEACYSTNNPASGRVMQKAEMKYEGTLRDGYICNAGFQDSSICSILKRDFEKECQD